MTTQTKGKQTAGQLLVRSLVNQDVKFIFGIPGGKIMPTFDVLNDEGPKIIVCRHEQNAAFIAEAKRPVILLGLGASEPKATAAVRKLLKRFRSGRIQLAGLHGLHVELPTSAAFLKANFEQSGLDDKIKASEG